MIYRVTHRTSYRYADLVSLSQNIVSMRPRDHRAQTCRSFDLSISPIPAVRSENLDYFGNSIAWFSVEQPHTHLTVEAKSEVEVWLELRPIPSQSIPWDQVRQIILESSDPEVIAGRQFTFDSLYVKRSPAEAAYALDTFPPGRPMLECVLDLTEKIHQDFQYLPGSTCVGTSSLEVLQTKKGVCQDFAHLQIACLRSLGLPARYVSGYLATTPPPGQPRLAASDSSHAWLSVFTPDFGWIDFDPTSGTMPVDSHVTVAWGRDYDDVSPIRGILIGGQRQRLDVSVDVAPQDAAS